MCGGGVFDVEPTLTARSAYAEEFVKNNGEHAFQFISYETGVKVQVNKAGIPMIIEHSVNDSDNSNYSLDEYLRSGQWFIFSRTVPLHN